MSKNREDLPSLNELSSTTVTVCCGAKLKGGDACVRIPMKNGRCCDHGGLSTGPKTEEGKMKSKRGNWIHGYHSKEEKEKRKNENKFIREAIVSLSKLNSIIY